MWKKEQSAEIKARQLVEIKAREEVEAQHRAWLNLVRRDLPRGHRAFVLGQKKQVLEAKKMADLCHREVTLIQTA